MPNDFNGKTSKIDLLGVAKALQDNINYNLNCVKIAKVVEFDPITITASCRIMNKRLVNLQNDGNQILEDYPLIYAKVHFFGWGDIGATFPVIEGMEGILLFNDRELQTWYKTGESGGLAYERCHDLTDAILIVGLHSEPNIQLVKFLDNCLNIYYKSSNIGITENAIYTNTTNDNINCTNFNVTSQNTNITGTTTITGTLTANGITDTTAFTGQFRTQEGRLVTVQSGIIKTIT